MKDGSLHNLVLADIITSHVEVSPDLEILTFESGPDDIEVRTFAELWSNANRLAAALIAGGMEYGDRFAIYMRNHPEFVELMIAASITGTVFVPIDPRTIGLKLSYTLNNSGCTGLVCTGDLLDQVSTVRSDVPGLRWIWSLGAARDEAVLTRETAAIIRPLGELLDIAETSVDSRLRSPTDPLQIIFTSGTTGDPKGIVFENQRFGQSGLVYDLLDIGRNERPYNGLSLTHGNAQLLTLAPSLARGQPSVFSRRFTKSRLWDVVRQHGCTTFNLLGGMATAIYSEPERPDDRDNPVRFVLSGGMPRAIWTRFEERFDLKILEAYGAMEGGMAFKPIGQGPVGSFGRPSPALEMKIFDTEDNECPAGVSGEIVSRPVTGERPSVKYYNNNEASIQKTRGGWLRSGDIGHRDAQGWFFFDHRKGSGIRRNGDFVNPGFVEAVVAASPHVNDVYVYGVPAVSGAPGERDIVVALVATDPLTFDAGAIFAACHAGLERNCVPSYLQLLDNIPKTASEKPQDRLLIQALCHLDARIYIPVGEDVRLMNSSDMERLHEVIGAWTA